MCPDMSKENNLCPFSAQVLDLHIDLLATLDQDERESCPEFLKPVGKVREGWMLGRERPKVAPVPQLPYHTLDVEGAQWQAYGDAEPC